MTTGDDTIIDQTLSERLLEKGRKSPFLVASLISLAGICGYGVYAFKKRKISTQMYLLQLRVAAQGTAIVCLTIGMAYHMILNVYLFTYGFFVSISVQCRTYMTFARQQDIQDLTKLYRQTLRRCLEEV